MWSGQGNWGGPWPIQQSAFANIPSEEVDWASLAKQWIAQREVMTMTSVPPVEPPFVPAPRHVAPPPPPPPRQASEHRRAVDMHTDQPAVGGNMVHPHPPQNMSVVDTDNCSSQDSNSEQTNASKIGWEKWNNSNWNAVPNWAVPPPPPPAESNDSSIAEGSYNSTESFTPSNSFNYNQGSNEFYQQPYEIPASGCGFGPYWNEQQMPPPSGTVTPLMGTPSPFEYRPAPRRGMPTPVPSLTAIGSLMEDSGLDAAKRRQLPAWIRDGLEKMEREKQKQLDREKQLQDELVAKRAQEMEAAKRTADADQGSMPPGKSRFDSDDDGDSGDSDREQGNAGTKRSPVAAVKPSESVPVMSEEEKQAQIMVKVRQMLTEVLLDVTNSEIVDIAHAVFKSAKAKEAKAPAKQLAKSSALASITSLGLGYGSDSDEEGAQTANDASAVESNDSSDDEDIRDRIRRKKIEFDRKMREMEEREQEDLTRREAVNQDRVKHEENSLLKPEIAGQSAEIKTSNHQEVDHEVEKKINKLRAEHNQTIPDAKNSVSGKHVPLKKAEEVRKEKHKLKTVQKNGLKKKEETKRKSSSGSKRRLEKEESESETGSSSGSESSSEDTSSDDDDEEEVEEEDESQSTKDHHGKSRHMREEETRHGKEKYSRHKTEIKSKTKHKQANREESWTNHEGDDRHGHRGHLTKDSRHRDYDKDRDMYDDGANDDRTRGRYNKDDRRHRTDKESDIRHGHRRTSDYEFDDRDSVKDSRTSSKSSHKKLRHSRSDSAESHHKSHRRHSSPADKRESKRHRRSTPLAYRSERETDRSGKKSSAKHKSRSVSR